MSFFKKIFFAFTRNERLAFVISALVAVISFAVVITIFFAQITAAVPTQGGAYTEGMVGQPEYINPVTAQSEVDLSLVKMLYSNLDDIADKIEVSPDGTTWTVHLKEGLTWQDGQKLTSDDVIFTVQSIQDPDAQSPLYVSWQGVAVSRISELELQFKLANPYAFFAENLKNLYIVPKHIFADIPPGNWHLSDYNLKPIGSGPYKFISYDQQVDGLISGYHLQAWNSYAGNEALIQNYNFQFFTNEADLIQSFNNGQIDGLGDISSEELATIKRPYDLFAWRTPGYYAVFFNQSKNLALQDPNMREALSQAVDRDSLVQNALGGEGVNDYGPIPPGAPYFAATETSTSLELASETLSAAGWNVTSGTFRAKLINKVSVPLTINVTVPNIDFLVTTANLLQQDWQAIGVQVTIATDSPEDIIANTVKNRDYESLLFGNILEPSSDLYSFWDSSQRFSPGLNLAIYENTTVDGLIESARQDMNDASRTQEFAKAEQDIVNDNPAVFLYSPDYLYVTNKSVRGISPDFLADPSDRLREATGWYLNTARVLK
jgi:peptide/nickel transport system substrate-binding protein